MNPYKLTFEQRPGYLFALLKAESTNLATARAYNRELADKCDESELNKILLVREIPMMMNTADAFEATIDFVSLMHGKKIAYVNPHARMTEDLEFVITVATNRGTKVPVFGDEAKAENWLLRD